MKLSSGVAMSLLTDQASQGTLGLGAAFGSSVQGPLSLPWDKGAFSTQPSPRTKIESIPENQLRTWLGDGPGPIPPFEFRLDKGHPHERAPEPGTYHPYSWVRPPRALRSDVITWLALV
jgi:hypothetical protein